MEFGVCGNAEMAAMAAAAAYDFVEGTVEGVLKPRESDDAFRAALDGVRAVKLPFHVLNCFVPADLKITGPTVDLTALRAYVTTTMERAEQAGVQVIVFGSGGARRIPDGFDASIARRQLLSFCSMLAPVALDHGVVVVVEPLSRADCNVLTSVAECAGLVREVAHPGLGLLVDAYHFMRDSDAYADIVANADLLRHVHIATVSNRLAPGAEPCDFEPFFRALAAGKYNGGISIEAKIADAARELPAALSAMRALTAFPVRDAAAKL